MWSLFLPPSPLSGCPDRFVVIDHAHRSLVQVQATENGLGPHLDHCFCLTLLENHRGHTCEHLLKANTEWDACSSGVLFYSRNNQCFYIFWHSYLSHLHNTLSTGQTCIGGWLHSHWLMEHLGRRRFMRTGVSFQYIASETVGNIALCFSIFLNWNVKN